MADNTELNAGSGGDTIATDDIGGIKWQRVKLTLGADGDNDGDVSATNKLPVSLDSETVTLGANSGVDIGDVDVTSILPGVGATNLGKAEDAAHSSGDVGVMALTVRQDADSAFGADGDYVPFQTDDNGYLKVNVKAGSSSGGTQYSTNDAYADGNAGTLALTIRDDALTTLAEADGDYSGFRVDSTGRLWCNVDNTVTVDGSGVTQPISASSLPLPTGAATSANQNTIIGHVDGIEGLLVTIDSDTSNLPTIETNTDFGTVVGGGTEATALRVTLANDSTGVVSVDDNGGSITVDSASLTDIETNTDYGSVTGGGTETGALRVTLANNSTGVLSVDDNGGSLTVDGTVTANLSATDNAVLDNIDANTTRGSSHYRNIDANAEAAIKASAGTLNWIHVMNMTAAVAYVHLYDAGTGSVTPGTTTPDFTFPIPTQGDTNGAGFFARLDQEFSTAITIVVTTTTDGSTGDPGTNGVFVNAGYA